MQKLSRKTYRALGIYIFMLTFNVTVFIFGAFFAQELPYPCHIPNFSNFWTIVALQIHYMINIIIISAGFEGLYFGLCIRTVMQIKVLKHEVKNVKLNSDSEDFFRNFVGHHDNLLKIFKKLRKIYSLLFTSKILLTTLITCFNIYNFTNKNYEVTAFTRNVQFVFFLSVQLFGYCLMASLVTEDANELSKEFFYLELHQNTRSSNLKTFMLLVIQRAQEPLKFTAGGIIEIEMVVITYVSLFVYLIYLFM